MPYLFYACGTGVWHVGPQASMEVGEDMGFLQVTSDALTPDKAAGMWQVWAEAAWGQPAGEGALARHIAGHW